MPAIGDISKYEGLATDRAFFFDDNDAKLKKYGMQWRQIPIFL